MATKQHTGFFLNLWMLSYMEKVAAPNVTEVSFWNRDSVQYEGLFHAWTRIFFLIHKEKLGIACLKQDPEPLTSRIEARSMKGNGASNSLSKLKDMELVLLTQLHNEALLTPSL